jgi:23S rRNA pseudouridine955/2504/2580 synthase
MSKKLIRLRDIILYEDDHVIAINKPANLASLHERFDSEKLSVIGMCREVSEEYRLCHRLDRETSGIMLIAKDAETYRNIAMQFESRSITKIYHALVAGSVELNELSVDLPLYTDSKRRVQISRKLGKESETVFNTIKKFRHFTLLSCSPLSGRLHQIRVHAASQNLPLVSDSLYGGKPALLSAIKRHARVDVDNEKPMIDRVALHAFSIEFDCPGKGRMKLEAPYPNDFMVILKLLEKYDSFAAG